jgi:hypothetical protein
MLVFICDGSATQASDGFRLAPVRVQAPQVVKLFSLVIRTTQSQVSKYNFVPCFQTIDVLPYEPAVRALHDNKPVAGFVNDTRHQVVVQTGSLSTTVSPRIITFFE